MTITTLSSREFNQDTSGAKKAAQQGPVFITDRGRPAHVLLTIEDYQRLTGGNMSYIARPERPKRLVSRTRLVMGLLLIVAIPVFIGLADKVVRENAAAIQQGFGR
jgi:prevent-host-death family protein